MSWFNSSLNTLKGQISTFAQEVLAENAENLPEEEPDVAVVLEEAHHRNEELSSLCAAKEAEITSLRKQISDLLAKASENDGKSKKSVLTIDKNASLEDSWCWEPDNIPSESSSKHDHEQHSESSSGGGELIAIPLDSHGSHDSEIIEKYQRFLDDRDARLKQLTAENSSLSEKITKLTDANVELQSNLEELDNQHNAAMKEVLDLKNDWQNKWNLLNNQQKALTAEHELKVRTFENDHGTLQKKFESIQSAYAMYVQENEVLKLELEKLKGDVIILEHEKAVSNGIIASNQQLEATIEELVAKLNEVEGQKVELQSQVSSDATKKYKDEDGFIVLQNEDLSANNFEQKYNTLLVEKDRILVDLEELRKELDAIKLDREGTKTELEKTIVSLTSDLENLKTQKSFSDNDVEINQYKSQISELSDAIKEHESSTVELESKLKSENLNLQKRIIDLESSINKSNAETGDNPDPIVKIDDLNGVVSAYTKIESPRIVDKSSMETVFKLIGDKVWKVEILEKNLKEMAEEVLQLKNEKETIDHDKTTLQADIVHYEVECAELMKNNEILLNELENYRKNKLETIPENNEEGIIMMERQLEESSSYMRNLEDQYNDIVEKLIQSDEKRYELEDVVEDLQESNTKLTNELKSLREHLELLENERSNLVFEINEMKTDDKKSAVEMEIQEHRHKHENLLGEYEHLRKEYSELQTRLSAKIEMESSVQKMTSLQYTVESLTSEKLALENELHVLQSQIEHYELKCAHLKDDNETLRKDIEEIQARKSTSAGTESVDLLERQLEEAQSSVRSIEDRFNEVAQRLMETEVQNNELSSELAAQQDNNTNLMSELATLKNQIDRLETEKNNLVFEVNELRTDDNKSEAILKTRLLDYESNIISLEAQLDRLGKDHADLVAALQSQKTNFSENRKKSEDRIVFLEKSLAEMEQVCHSAHEKVKLNDEVIATKQQEIDELHARMHDEHDQLSSKSEGSLQELNELRQQIDGLTQEKANLIATITTKHNETTQYYMEIQRLSQLLQLESEKSKTSTPSNCENCQQLQITLDQTAVSHKDEMEKIRDQINFLKEKSDILTSNLMSEQSNQRLLLHEKSELAEKNASLQRDLERLREHLVEMEEAHTRETLELQNSMDDTKAKMLSLQEQVSNSSNAYTSASIRATQHAETLQAQYLLVCQQRDEYATKLSAAEDKESKNQAALINLQCALEQFQKEKETNIQSATLRLRKELQNEYEKQNELQSEMKTLHGKLAEANQGLLAAARLSDQLEASQVTITSLKEETARKEEKINSLEEKLQRTQENQADKVEKNLVKSLLIGYIVSANPNDKNQILKLITTVLDFNATETDRVGLNKTQGGWLTGFLQGGGGQTGGDQSKDSLAQAFVNFLEKESQPRPNLPNLPQMGADPRRLSTASMGSGAQPARRLSQHSTSSNPSATTGVQPILLNESFLEQFAPSRNSSSILKDILSSDP